MIAVSGTIAADSDTYHDYAGREDILGTKFFSEPDIQRVIEDGPLVAWTYYPSLVFATVTAAALAWTLVGVVVIARARVTRASPPA